MTTVTQCPGCQTSFRVTNEQISMAEGMVRCGACLRVFEVLAAADEPADQAAPDAQISPYETTPSETTPRETTPHKTSIQPDQEDYWDCFARYARECLVIDSTVEPEIQDLLGVPEDAVAGLVAELEAPGATRSVAIHGSWYLSAAACVLLLVLQHVWFQRDVYSQNVDFRPYYERACSTLPCDLPEYRNPDALNTSNLVIRSHPDIDNALMLDAILANHDNYRQRFPDVELRFTNLENRPVARRRFSPREYLAGELRGIRYIPANTEVRFSLEIQDPGSGALGYQMDVIPSG